MNALHGPVLVIGTGLLGTSIGLVCRRAGLEVLLSDSRASHLRTASGLGAGRPVAPDDVPQLVVVAVPPDHLGATIVRALEEYDAVVTDVGSIKAAPLAEVRAAVSADRLAKYVGSHPMAGSERSGPLAASEALFDGRPWAIAAHRNVDPSAVVLVEELATLCGAVLARLTPEDHDLAVARTSHLPHLISALVAGQLADAPEAHLALSGQGVRDVTRVAGSDPALWQQIVAGNAPALLQLLGEVRGQLDLLMAAVGAGEREALGTLLARGVSGTQAIPGKHGGVVGVMTSVFVTVPDHPGELARLFADAGAIGVNIEDVRIDHDPGRDTGLVELLVQQPSASHLASSLESRGWVTHG